ncbi:MAG: HD domain-containing protein [Nitrospiraceae bacterium]|nr:HD domain-containing protein [Nitrospiraceae bacterium]
MGEKARDAGIQTALAFAEEHDPDLDHAVQVAENSLALFDATRGLHGLGDWERMLLHAAALMHDVGYENRPDKHHKGSRDLILESGLDEFSPRELMMIACVARYHRKAEPLPGHSVYRDLDETDRAVVERLAALIRIGDGLDRTHAGAMQGVRVERTGAGICFHLKQRRYNETDIWGGMRKRGLFERVFGLAVEIVAE